MVMWICFTHSCIPQTQNDYLREYLDKRQELLIEILRHESPLRARSCTICGLTLGTYRCDDCFRAHLLCAECCVSSHSNSPFHRIRQFNGQYFERSDLDMIGMVLDLRQHKHECNNPAQPTGYPLGSDDDLSEDDVNRVGSFTFPHSGRHRSMKSNLIIVSSTGIFKRSIRWCHCANSPEPFIQLLRARLFPASFATPSSAFTFKVLDHFRIDALECKTAALTFMSKIRRISNEAFPSKVPVRAMRFKMIWKITEPA